MQSTIEPKGTVSEVREITRMSATSLARHIASGGITAVEAVEAHIEQIERWNPQLNGVVVKRYAAARDEAMRADLRRRQGELAGPLHGVPVTVKECLDLEGTPSTFGIPSRAGDLAGGDEPHVARLRQAGGIVLGKTNVAQLLFYYESDNPLYGRTSNPWNVDRTPGGSSGGEAAIIAAGGSAMGIGTDIGGSLRVPAAFCGIASLKPTAGRTPDRGRFSIPYGQQAIQSQVGILARHVEDVALGMEIINGGSDPVVEPPMPLHDFRAVDVGGLRIAFYTDDGTLGVAPSIKRGVLEAAEVMRKRGATVTEWAPPDAADAMAMVYAAFTADGGAWMRRLLGKERAVPQIGKLLGVLRLPHRGLSMLLKLMGSLGQHGTVMGMRRSGHRETGHYWQLVEAIEDYRDRFAAALDAHPGGPFDAIISPSCSLPAFTHGASTDLVTAGAYACLYNLLGYPAGVVPVSRVAENEQVGRVRSRDVVEKRALQVETGSTGLPVGVQVVARPWREHVALAVMGAIEESARRRHDFPHAPVEGWSVVSSQ